MKNSNHFRITQAPKPLAVTGSGVIGYAPSPPDNSGFLMQVYDAFMMHLPDNLTSKKYYSYSG